MAREYESLTTTEEPYLVILAQTGDNEAFEELVRRRQGYIRKLSLHLSRNQATADDLAQETFLAAWRKLHTLKSPGAFGGWLRQIAVNLFLQHVRRHSSQKEELSDWDIKENPVQKDPAIQLDLQKALERLRPIERLCVVLSYAERLSHSEICSATGLPLGTVKSHIARGSKQLRKDLKAYKGGV